MDILEVRVPRQDMDQNENEGKENGNENPFQQQPQSDPSAKKKKSEFLSSLGGDSGDLVESVAMDLISRQAESLDVPHHHNHHHQQQQHYHPHNDT
jgi:hypothetical protein